MSFCSHNAIIQLFFFFFVGFEVEQYIYNFNTMKLALLG